MKKAYTPELQAAFTNEILSQFAQSLDKALRERLREITPKVPSQTIARLRYEIMQASATDISARYGLYFQDSGRHSEMKKLQAGKPLPIDVILAWIKKGRQGLFKQTPGYQETTSRLSQAKKIERIAAAIAFSKAKGTIRRGKERKERAWINKTLYGWYNRLISDFIEKQSEFFKGMIKEGFQKDLGEVPL